MDKPPAVIPAKAGIQEPPAVTIESAAGGAATLTAAGSVRERRAALRRGSPVRTPLSGQGESA